jgi:hypothetical protein
VIRDDLNVIVATAFQPAMFDAYGIPDWNFEWRERLGDESIEAGESGHFVELGHADFLSRTIRMSASAARESTEWDVYQTMLHEIAHALVGVRSGHGPTWDRVAREIGCQADFHETHGKHTYLAYPGRRGRGILDT